MARFAGSRDEAFACYMVTWVDDRIESKWGKSHLSSCTLLVKCADDGVRRVEE